MLSLDCEIVGSVADGSALVETAERLRPDVIVLDMNLPNIRSVEACREITRRNPETKVIMFTVMEDPNASQAFFEAGASAFVSKLASADLLLDHQATVSRPGLTPAARRPYSAGPIVKAMVPTPAIVPWRTSPGATGPTPSGVPV